MRFNGMTFSRSILHLNYACQYQDMYFGTLDNLQKFTVTMIKFVDNMLMESEAAQFELAIKWRLHNVRLLADSSIYDCASVVNPICCFIRNYSPCFTSVFRNASLLPNYEEKRPSLFPRDQIELGSIFPERLPTSFFIHDDVMAGPLPASLVPRCIVGPPVTVGFPSQMTIGPVMQSLYIFSLLLAFEHTVGLPMIWDNGVHVI